MKDIVLDIWSHKLYLYIQVHEYMYIHLYRYIKTAASHRQKLEFICYRTYLLKPYF